MRNLWISMGFTFGLLGATSAFAEPAVQPGETLESLSQVKISTTVNGQPGSLQDLISSGKFQPVTPETTTPSNEQPQPASDMPPPPPANGDQPAPPNDAPPPAQ